MEEDAVRRAVREHVEHGADVIKIMATGGHMTTGTDTSRPQYTLAELRAAVEEAHALGRMVAAHAHGPDGIAVAIDAGVDDIEHCSFRVPGSPTGRDPRPALVERIAQKRIFVCPTVGTPPAEVIGAEAALRAA